MRSATAITRGETDFLRRQNNRFLQKQKKIKTIKLKSIHLFFILSMLSFMAFGIYKTGQFVLNWEKLKVKSFNLTNIPRGKETAVNSVLEGFRGNILVIDAEALRAQLVAIPEVKEVTISRILPSTIEIIFQLRVPAFQVEKNGLYTIVDKEGVVLYEGAGQRDDLITIVGTEKPQWQKIIPFFPELNKIRKSLLYVAYKEPYGLVLKINGINETFYPGEVDFTRKINYYLKLKEQLSLGSEKIINVDLRFEDRFYLEYEEEVTVKNET